MFSLNDFLDFNPINNYYKSRVFPCANGKILDITFKFKTGSNMRLIFDCLYAPRKKRRLLNHLALICGHNLCRPFTIDYYIDFIFLFFFFIILLFLFFYFSFKFSDFISWNFVTLFSYILLIWKIQRFFLKFMSVTWKHYLEDHIWNTTNKDNKILVQKMWRWRKMTFKNW
jgi:hypothetical protein